MIETFDAARKKSVPLIGIKTPDPAATQYEICMRYKDSPLVTWDGVNGLRGINSKGTSAVRAALGSNDASNTTSPVDALGMAVKFPEETILFTHNLQMFISAADQTTALIVQAIWNLRDSFKSNRRMLVALGTWFILPPEINQDIVVLDEPLPNDDQLSIIIEECYKNSSPPLQLPSKVVMAKAVDALRGLAAFPSEQVTAMSLAKEGLDLAGLWERKRQMIEQTPGLSIWRGTESFENIKGYDNAERYLKRIFDGRLSPKAVMFIDEID